MKILLMLGGAFVALIGIVLLVGALLPTKHVASREIVVRKPPPEVYATIRDFASATEWRTDLKATEMLEPVNGRIRFPRRLEQRPRHLRSRRAASEREARHTNRPSRSRLPRIVDLRASAGRKRHAYPHHRERRSAQCAVPVYVPLRLRPHRHDGHVPQGARPQVRRRGHPALAVATSCLRRASLSLRSRFLHKAPGRSSAPLWQRRDPARAVCLYS